MVESHSWFPTTQTECDQSLNLFTIPWRIHSTVLWKYEHTALADGKNSNPICWRTASNRVTVNASIFVKDYNTTTAPRLASLNLKRHKKLTPKKERTFFHYAAWLLCNYNYHTTTASVTTKMWLPQNKKSIIL